MDPTNPRWEPSEARANRRATTWWKVIVGAAAAGTLAAIVVASCLDRDEARRDRAEPAYVETTSATSTVNAAAAAHAVETEGPPTAAPATPSTHDSTGGTTTLTSAPVHGPELNYTPALARFESRSGDTSTSGTGADLDGGTPVAGHASHANNDPNNRTSNPVPNLPH